MICTAERFYLTSQDVVLFLLQPTKCMGGTMKRLILNLLLLPFGCGGGAPSMPPPSPPPPEQQDEGVIAARDGERKRKLQAASQTILTNARGIDQTQTQGKTLLGQ